MCEFGIIKPLLQSKKPSTIDFGTSIFNGFNGLFNGLTSIFKLSILISALINLSIFSMVSVISGSLYLHPFDLSAAKISAVFDLLMQCGFYTQNI